MTLHPDFLHNIAELETEAPYYGLVARRWPRAVAECLENGALASMLCTLSEVRVVIEEGPRAALCLTSLNGSDLMIYRGDLLHIHQRLSPGVLTRVILDGGHVPFAPLRPEALTGHNFSPRVWRVVLDDVTLLHGLDPMGCRIRPPRPDEVPARRWIAYGSSITHGYTPVTRMQCYVAQTARRLGVDVVNLGLSGACRLEPAAIDYLATRNDWDFMTCELGVNMRDQFTPAIFAERARNLVQRLTDAHPGKPLVLISPFTTAADHLVTPTVPSTHTAGYREALARIVGEAANPQLHLIDGRDILPDIRGLTCDLVHPSTEGHTLMAENLAGRLRKLLPFTC